MCIIPSILVATLLTSALAADIASPRCNNSSNMLFDVVVVGNGPSGLALGSALRWHWTVEKLPPRSAAAPVLAAATALLGGHLTDAAPLELHALGETLSARCESPVSAVVDKMRFPIGDGGGRSLLQHQRRPDAPRLSTLVVGRGPPGGAWHQMRSDRAYTLSPAEWMSLPGLTYAEWCGSEQRAGERASRPEVADYLRTYAEQLVDGENVQLRQAAVVKASPHEFEDSQPGWRVQLKSPSTNETTEVFARSLVVAAGTYDEPARLQIPGETLPFVRHRPAAPDDQSSEPGELLVVGAGLSASDAVIAALAGDRHTRVVHVFRGEPRGTRIGRMFGGGSGGMYSEESELAALMAGHWSDQRYQPVRGELKEITPDGRCRVLLVDGRHEEFTAANVAILVGSQPDYSWLEAQIKHPSPLAGGTKLDGNPSSHPRFIAVEPSTGEVLQLGGGKTSSPLYSVGPARGDNFIRFVVGDAVAVAHSLHDRLFNTS